MISQKNRRFLAIGFMCLSFANVFSSSPLFQSEHISPTQETLSQAYLFSFYYLAYKLSKIKNRNKCLH
jgi:hypothetical protein